MDEGEQKMVVIKFNEFSGEKKGDLKKKKYLFRCELRVIQ